MKTLTLSISSGQVIEQTMLANTPLLRLRGLLGRPKLNLDQGLLISPCNSVHTMGMSYPLDLVFLDNNNRVIKLTRALKPWRASSCLKATKVLELVAGNITTKNINQGDILSW
jgi:uncharacterized membrane protein (UPF0127 family)